LEEIMKLVSHRAISLAMFSVVCALGTGCGASDGSTSGAADLALSSGLDLSSHRLPTLPDPSLAVPAGNRLAFALLGVGTQNYTCQATATGAAWTFTAPDATLFDSCGKVAGHHFAGPTWQANDGSTVVGAKIAAFTVDPASIPWLLLQAKSTTPATTNNGPGRMSDVTYVQRLETTGGLAPATGCDVDHIGDTADVDYTAKYFFYESSDGG
jgi:hypothetical protein